MFLYQKYKKNFKINISNTINNLIYNVGLI